MMRTSVENKIAVGTAVCLLVLISIGFFSYYTTGDMERTAEWVSHTHEVIATIDSGMALLTDAETQQRGYLITGDPAFKQDSLAAQAKVGDWMKLIRAETADNPVQQKRLADLEPLINQRLAVLNDRIKLREEKGLEGVAAAVGSRQGKNLMDQIWQRLGEIRSTEQGLLVEREQAARHSAEVNRLVVVGSSTVAVIAGLLAFGMIQRDLRLREKLQSELTRNEAMLESILDNTPSVIFMKDLEGRYMFVNQRFVEVSGLSRAQITGKRAQDITRPDLAAAADNHFRTVMETGKPTEFEETVVYPDGPRRHLAVKFPLRNAEGKIYAMAGISTDITERQRFEQLLKDSEERLRLLVDNIKDYAIMLLDMEGRMVRCNAGAVKILGYTAEEFTGEHLSRLYPADQVRAGLPEKQLATATAEGRYEDEGWRLRKDGSQFWANTVVTAIRDTAGNLKGFACIAGDLTRQKMAEHMLKQLNQSLRHQAAELETTNRELEAFSYSVSHDLRSPLRHIDGFVDLLRKHSGGKLDDRGLRFLNIIADSARQMGCLIDDLLVFSRMGRVEMRHTAVSPNSLVEEAVQTAKNDANGRNIVWDVQKLPVVEADPAMLRQVWVNLINNAVKYTRNREEAHIEVGCTANGSGEYVFYVRDNGVGFDMQYVNKLFGVFQRLHRAEEFEGTGIGLANVRRIVSRHGGRTWAEGKLNEGATIYFTLPRHKTEMKG